MKNDFANKGVHELLKLCGFNKPVKIVKYNGKNRVEEVKPMYDVIKFHDSRKSFGCNLIQGNMDLQSVSDLMGVNIQTLIEWYSKSNQQERNKKALNILKRFQTDASIIKEYTSNTNNTSNTDNKNNTDNVNYNSYYNIALFIFIGKLQLKLEAALV